jgi:hypothetical protein
MASRVARWPIRSWIWLAVSPLRASSRVCRMFLIALAGALGPPKPKLLRHEEAVAQVAEDEATEK